MSPNLPPVAAFTFAGWRVGFGIVQGAVGALIMALIAMNVMTPRMPMSSKSNPIDGLVPPSASRSATNEARKGT